MNKILLSILACVFGFSGSFAGANEQNSIEGALEFDIGRSSPPTSSNVTEHSNISSLSSSPRSSDSSSDEEIWDEITEKNVGSLSINVVTVQRADQDLSKKLGKDRKIFKKIMNFFNPNLSISELKSRIPDTKKVTQHGLFLLATQDGRIISLFTPMGIYDLKNDISDDLKVTNSREAMNLERSMVKAPFGLNLEATVVHKATGYRSGVTTSYAVLHVPGLLNIPTKFEDYFTSHDGDMTPTSEERLWNAIKN